MYANRRSTAPTRTSLENLNSLVDQGCVGSIFDKAPSLEPELFFTWNYIRLVEGVVLACAH